MALDPRTPVVVGVGEVTNRTFAVDTAVEPAALCAQALSLAADDAGPGRALLERATGVRVVDILAWRYPDPASKVAELLGIEPAERLRSATGGNSPQLLLNDAAVAIAAGRHDVVLITGAEAMYSRTQARKHGVKLDWSAQPADTPPCQVLGDERPGNNEPEAAAGLFLPVVTYPLFEHAVRRKAGRSVAEHRAVVGGLWSRFSKVAAGNPHAWAPSARTPEEITTPGPDNRMVASPYTKWQVANIQVDQAAAVVVCSVEAARAAGVPEDRWVFPLAGADAHDHWFVSERWTLDESVAVAAIGRAVAELSGRSPADARWVDLYSCFPVAVELAAAALGLPLDDPERPLTLTGGLTFGGGPGNNYATHGIAKVVDACRRDPGSLGLSTALGWYATKHSLGLYSTEPPDGGFAWRSAQAEVDATPSRVVAAGYEGPGTLETGTVVYDRDGNPERGICAVLTPEGHRTWAAVAPDGLGALEAGEGFGEPVRVAGGIVSAAS